MSTFLCAHDPVVYFKMFRHVSYQLLSGRGVYFLCAHDPLLSSRGVYFQCLSGRGVYFLGVHMIHYYRAEVSTFCVYRAEVSTFCVCTWSRCISLGAQTCVILIIIGPRCLLSVSIGPTCVIPTCATKYVPLNIA